MNKKLTAIFATMLIALCLAGVSYAMWSKILYIDGTVDTGEVNAIWTSAFNYDQGYDPNPDGTFKDKDVGSTTVTGVGTQTLVITVNNGYPSYFNDIQVEFTNTGTIPVKIQSINIIPDNFDLATACGANDGEIWIDFVNGIGSQLDSGDSAAGSFKFHVEQPAAENTQYTFTVEVLLVQWNEYQ